jgi:hypothetical protein
LFAISIPVVNSMDNSIALFPVLDIAGVEGAFIIDKSSNLIALNCKPIFSPDLVQRAAIRISTLFTALGEYLRPAHEVILSFEHFQVIVRRREELLIAVIVQGQVNQVALKLACNVAVKKIQEQAAAPVRPATAPAIAPRPVPAARPTPAAPAPAPVRRPSPPAKSSGIWGESIQPTTQQQKEQQCYKRSSKTPSAWFSSRSPRRLCSSSWNETMFPSASARFSRSLQPISRLRP